MTEEIRPLIPECAATEATNVEVVLTDMQQGYVRIPDYQRDSNQWSPETKSLLVESVINNLSVPAFFFERIVEDGLEKNEVIDGQQRLTTLHEFFTNSLRLVDSGEAAYLSPNSIHYAGKKYDDLPEPYRQAFKRYRLTIIKLRDLGDMRLEIFRRINQGGTPLSGQDIRLAYYGQNSPSLAFIRLVGVYDEQRQASQRFLMGAKDKYDIDFPWDDELALDAWNDWWNEKDIAHGQTASEAFLWSLLVAQVQTVDEIIRNSAALQGLGVQYHRAIDDALDVYCAQLRWQDANLDEPAALLSFSDMRSRYFPYFQEMIKYLLAQKGPNLPVTKHRAVASVIGAAFRANCQPASLSDAQWTDLVEFVRRPADIARSHGFEWPQSRGKWDGTKGYRTQMETAQKIVGRIVA